MTSDSVGKPEVRARLRGAGIHPTSQRVEVAHSLLSQNAHLSAEDVAREVNREYPMVSRATVYNSLALFVTHGLIREVVVEPGKMLYDPNVSHHHHISITLTPKNWWTCPQTRCRSRRSHSCRRELYCSKWMLSSGFFAKRSRHLRREVMLRFR